MSQPLKQSATESWKGTVATITACKRTFSTSMLVEGEPRDGIFELAEYDISFSYEVGSEMYEGKYRTGSPQEVGHTFEILYDPTNPQKNTWSDIQQGTKKRIVLWTLGVLTAAVLIWLEKWCSF